MGKRSRTQGLWEVELEDLTKRVESRRMLSYGSRRSLGREGFQEL